MSARTAGEGHGLARTGDSWPCGKGVSGDAALHHSEDGSRAVSCAISCDTTLGAIRSEHDHVAGELQRARLDLLALAASFLADRTDERRHWRLLPRHHPGGPRTHCSSVGQSGGAGEQIERAGRALLQRQGPGIDPDRDVAARGRRMPDADRRQLASVGQNVVPRPKENTERPWKRTNNPHFPHASSVNG